MSETLPEDDGTVNEITRASVPRQDAVVGPATGRPFLLLKNQLARRTTPAQAAAAMLAASQRDKAERLYKAKYDAEALRRMGAAGHAFRNDDGTYSYPIGDTEDLHDAIRSVGRGGASHDAIRRYIRRRANDLGATGAIPDSWSGEGKITKAMDIEEVHDDLQDLHEAAEITPGDANDEAAGTVEATHPGDPSDPGSPAWEAVDAATARGALAFANKLKMILCKLREREGQEVVTEGADSDHVLDLTEAESALEFMTGVLAAFANAEQAEADHAAHEIEQQAEAMGIRKSQEETPVTDPTPTPPTAPEPLVKAGLSADDMRSMMKKLLASMSDEQVAQAFAEMASHATVGGGEQDDAPADENPGGPAGAAAPPAAPAPAPMDKAAAPGSIPAPASVNRSAVPGPDSTPTAADDNSALRKSQDSTQEQPFDLMKALTTFGDQLTARFEETVQAKVDQVVAPMQEELKKMQQRVAPGGPLLNGVNTPPPSVEGHTVTRGHAADTGGNVDELAELRKQLDQMTDPNARAAAQNQLAIHAMRSLQDHVGPPPMFGSRIRPAAPSGN